MPPRCGSTATASTGSSSSTRWRWSWRTSRSTVVSRSGLPSASREGWLRGDDEGFEPVIKRSATMVQHKVVSPDEWTEARKRFLAKEKEFTRLRDELNRERRELPWVK